MALLLLEVSQHPGEIAATKVGACTKGRSFLLDFSRPLRTERWLGVWNFRVGYPVALHVPVVHEREAAGTRFIAIERGDAYFAELQRLWRSRYPKAERQPAEIAEAAVIARDFELHFPQEAAGGASGHGLE